MYLKKRRPKELSVRYQNVDGDFIDTWGEGKFTRPHSIFIDDEDFLYLVDDGGHCVYK